jgi:hypothetical protein
MPTAENVPDDPIGSVKSVAKKVLGAPPGGLEGSSTPHEPATWHPLRFSGLGSTTTK